MLLKTKISLGISSIFLFVEICFFIFGHNIPQTIEIAVLITSILAIYVYTQYIFTPLDKLLKEQPDFSKRPAKVNEVAYLRQTLKYFIEKDQNDSLQRNTLLINNELLLHLNDTISEILDGVGQGFLTFDIEGKCGNISSTACIALLGTDPKGKYIFDVLGIPESDHTNIKDIIEMIFTPSHALSVEDLFAFFPQELFQPSGLVVKLSYKAIAKKEGTVVKVVVIATDKTAEVAAIKMLDEERTKAKITIKIGQRRKDFINFIKDFREIIAILSNTAEEIEITTLKNTLHSLKGFAGLFGLKDVIMSIHEFETSLNHSSFSEALEIHTAKLNNELNNTLHIATLILGDDFECIGEVRHIKATKIHEFIERLKSDKNNEKLLQDFLNNIAATPITEIVSGFQTSLSDVAASLGKQISPIKTNSNVNSLFMDSYTQLFNSFIHIFNNIVDHGIEVPDKRLEMGKTPEGNIIIEFFVRQDKNNLTYLYITISDDGGGINPERIKEKLKSLNPNGSWVRETDQEIIQHIFDSGFSTKNEISTLSGRGIGMDAVREIVEGLGGNIYTESKVGVGTKFTIKIPYSYANESTTINIRGDAMPSDEIYSLTNNIQNDA